MSQKVLRFFVQPWGEYNPDHLPGNVTASADYVSLTYVFTGTDADLEVFLQELHRQINANTTAWLGILLRDMPTYDPLGPIYLVDVNPNFHASVAAPQRQLNSLVIEVGNGRILCEH